MENIRKLYNGLSWNESINMMKMDFNQFHFSYDFIYTINCNCEFYEI